MFKNMNPLLFIVFALFIGLLYVGFNLFEFGWKEEDMYKYGMKKVSGKKGSLK